MALLIHAVSITFVCLALAGSARNAEILTVRPPTLQDKHGKEIVDTRNLVDSDGPWHPSTILSTLFLSCSPRLSNTKTKNTINRRSASNMLSPVEVALDALERAPQEFEIAAAAAIAAFAAFGIFQSRLPPPPVELLQGRFEGSKWVNIYKASRDGWSAEAFHEKCDDKGPAFVMTTNGAQIVGGFNVMGWDSTDDYRFCSNFLFGRYDNKWVKIPLRQGSVALFDNARSGPHFGTGDLVIGRTQAQITGAFTGPDMMGMESCGDLREATSVISSYTPGPGRFARSLFNTGYPVTLREVEVWVNEENL